MSAGRFRKNDWLRDENKFYEGGKRTHTIYIDILFCVNFIIDYTMLVSVKRFLSLNTRTRRLLLGAFIGALSSFVILIPAMPKVLSVLYNIAAALILTAAAFLPVKRIVYIKAAAAFFMISFCFCGLMTAALAVFSPQNVVIRNSTVYIGISPFVLIALTLICYIAMRIIFRITGRSMPKKIKCRVSVTYQGKTVEADGTVDTGNTLHEPFSGESVIVGRADTFKTMLDAERCMKLCGEGDIPEGVRLVPFSSVGGCGVIPAFKPASVKIINDNQENEVNAYIALCSDKNMTNEVDMLVPAELIMKGS